MPRPVALLQPLPQPRTCRVRYPPVLMHGFGAIVPPWSRGRLDRHARHLRGHTLPAFAPNVPPYGTIEQRAEAWGERLEVILEATGAERVNLIAHSMAGLDARWLVSITGWHARVASITTISTPHRGSYLADLARRSLPPFPLLRGYMSLVGRLAYPQTPPRVAAALKQLTPQHLQTEFNPAVPDHPTVAYFCYDARAGQNAPNPITPVLWLQNRLLYAREGSNDGFVSQRSARWGEPLGTVDADHLQQVGVHLWPTRFQSQGFFLSVVERLAARGF